MDLLKQVIDFILHVDDYLGMVVTNYGAWTYFVLFLIIFCETGLVVTPFLPGDSLLFAAGALAVQYPDALSLLWLVLLLSVAAVFGDAVNYTIGHTLGAQLAARPRWFLKQEHLDRTYHFYEKHGGKTIIMARFVPIVRTFAPFVAGMGKMTYGKFFMFNVVGGVVWVVLFLVTGYLFGNVEIVKHNFELVAVGIVVLSLLPILVEWLRSRREPVSA